MKPSRRVVTVRIFFGVALTAGFGAFLFIDYVTETNYASTLAALGVVALGLHEFYRLQERGGLRPFRAGGMTAGILLILAQWLKASVAGQEPALALDPVDAVLFAFLLTAALRALVNHREDRCLASLAVTVAGLLYVWLPVSFLFALRNYPSLDHQAGVAVVLHLLVVAKVGDVGAFFTGRFLGKRKLAPTVSPGKTVEGAVGGLTVGLAASVALVLAVPVLGDTYGVAGALVFGMAVGLLALAGDLFESLLKRRAHVKNSGDLIPEFGGLLDLLDCLLFAGPAAYFLLACFT